MIGAILSAKVQQFDFMYNYLKTEITVPLREKSGTECSDPKSWPDSRFQTSSKCRSLLYRTEIFIYN